MRIYSLFLATLMMLPAGLPPAQGEVYPSSLRNLLGSGQIAVTAVPVTARSIAAAVINAGGSYAAMSTYALSPTGDIDIEIWQPSWHMESDGWVKVEGGPSAILSASPDGQWLCYDLWADLPDSFDCPNEHMRRAEIIVISRPDGSEARPVAVTIMVGGGPQFDFTSDSKWLVGQPFLGCRPTPESYAAYLNGDWNDPETDAFNYYNLETGDYGWIEDLDVGDGYWKCPYSDNYRIENNWYAEHRFSNFKTGRLLGEWIAADGQEGFISGWVLPDAVLLSNPGNTGLLYVDGSFKPAPNDGWEVYCWLPDGNFLFSDDAGASVKYGKVDWSSFTVDWWVDRSDLLDYVEMYSLHPLCDSSGVLFTQWGGGELLYTELNHEGAKP